MFVFFCCLLQRKPNIFYPPVPLVPSVPTVPPVASRCNPVALNFPNPTAAAPLRAIDQPLPLPPPRCRKRNEVPTVTHLIAKVTLGSQPPFDTPSHSSVLFIIIIIFIILIFFWLLLLQLLNLIDCISWKNWSDLVLILWQYEGLDVDLIRLDASTKPESTIDEFDPLGEAKCQQQQQQQQSNPVYSFHVPRQKAEPQVANGAFRPAASNGVKGYTSRFSTGSDPFSDLLAFTRTNYGPPIDDESHFNEPKESSLATNPPPTWTKFD